nr:HrpE/YscL family type III secretion apparatus protein [Pectobacterium colocasium]
MTKTFVTLPGASRDETVIIPAEQVAAHRRSRALWEEASAQSDTIVAQAHERARTLCEQAVEHAEAEFWQQANALLQGIQQDRMHLEKIVITQAGQLLRDALAHVLDKHLRRHAITLYCGSC